MTVYVNDLNVILVALFLLWPVCGWVAALAYAPKGRVKDEPIYGLCTILICGGLLGPLILLASGDD